MTNIRRIKCGNGNCYILEENGNAILVDTARTKYRENILSVCRKTNIRLIVLTHAHMDHCQNAAFISEKLNVPIAICQADEELIKDNMLQPLHAKTLAGKVVLFFSVKSFYRDKIPPFAPEVYLQDGDSLEKFGISAKIVGLPGHTNGSIGIDFGKDGIIVGDALMNMFYPTVSMLYHDCEQMLESAKKISGMGERIVYFGHGKPKKNRDWAR
ncbi:MAG: MBL fold metallo-hydrolase [Treponema sp.]|nr:MBL fold metallo-hydrolase [Treponema sp.]